MNCTMRIIRLRELYYACSTIFFKEVRCKTGRVVREADPYGSATRSAVGRDDVGIVPYGYITRSAGKNSAPFRQGGHGDGGTDCHGRKAPSQ